MASSNPPAYGHCCVRVMLSLVSHLETTSGDNPEDQSKLWSTPNMEILWPLMTSLSP